MKRGMRQRLPEAVCVAALTESDRVGRAWPTACSCSLAMGVPVRSEGDNSIHDIHDMI
jgi:hypothetical protein